jgi:hypothetical protein
MFPDYPPKAGNPAWKTGPHKRVIVSPLIHGDGEIHGPHGLINGSVRVAKVDQASGISLAGIVTLEDDVMNSCSAVVIPIRASKGAPCVAVYAISPSKGPLGGSPLFRCGVTAAEVLYEADVDCSIVLIDDTHAAYLAVWDKQEQRFTAKPPLACGDGDGGVMHDGRDPCDLAGDRDDGV